MSAQIYSTNNGEKLVYEMGNRRAIVSRKGGEIRYNVRVNTSSEWRHANNGPHVRKHIDKVKAAVA